VGLLLTKIKNVILRDYFPWVALPDGLDIIHRKQPNGENYATLTGTKKQINEYLQDKEIVSDRLRTLKNLPTCRIINTHKVRIY
jgi:hypothetical protein